MKTALLKNNPQVESKTMRSKERDIESQNNITENDQKNDSERKAVLHVPLKSILKNVGINVEDETRAELMVVKCFTLTILMIITIPFIVCDLYFGFNNNHCINKLSNELYFTMKMYLLGSGFIGLAGIIMLICLMRIDINTIQFRFVNHMIIIGGIIQIIWHILGAVTYWGTIYKEDICDINVSTYICVSLIIKLGGNLFIIIQKLNLLE